MHCAASICLTAEHSAFAVILVLCVTCRAGKIVVILRSRADILEQFRDLEFSGFLGFGGSILNGFARGLKLGFFG